MNPVLMGATGRMLTLSLALLSGCSTSNPDWITAPVGAFCGTSFDAECLRSFAEHANNEATAGAVEKAKAAATESEAAAARAKVAVDDSKEPATPEQDLGMCLIPDDSDPDSPPSSDTRNIPVGSKAVVEGTAEGLLEKALPEASAAVQQEHEFDHGLIPALGFGVEAIGASANDAAGYKPSDPVKSYRDAGGLLDLSDDLGMDGRLEKALALSDPDLRAKALTALLTLYSRRMTDAQQGSTLNALYELDREHYETALIIKLPGLLKIGDFERAKALRSELLKTAQSTSRAFSMLAYVASCYTLAGMDADAGAIVREAVKQGAQLSKDDATLVRMALEVGRGGYPSPQDFYDFRNDQARLDAYLTLAVFARQVENPAIERKAVWGAVKFIQKSSVRIDKQEALASILMVAPGVVHDGYLSTKSLD